MQSRMKQSDCFSCSGFDRRNVRAFITIAEDAAVGQIVKTGAAAVFSTYDVIDLMSEFRPALRVKAVFAMKFGANEYFTP